MPKTSLRERRERFRAVLERPRTTNLASIFDAASARIAEAAGFEVGFMAGSIASATVLGAPDIVLLSLSEFAGQSRRIGRACDLPFMVDADHGYGNALNVMRTVEELETAGVAALTIEDTELPRAYGSKEAGLIPREEFADKLRAALAARSDPSLVIVGRVGALARAGLEETVARARICTEVGVDALHFPGLTSIDQDKAIHAVTSLPIIHNTVDAPADELAANGVRLINQGHVAYYAMLQSLHHSYTHMANGGDPAALEDPEQKKLSAIALAEGDYAAWGKDFLGLK